MPDREPSTPGAAPRTSSNPAVEETDNIPSMNGGLKNRKEIRVSLSVLIGVIMMLVGMASFAANYLFASKSEMAETEVAIIRAHSDDVEKIHEISTKVVELKGEVGIVKQEIQTIKTTQSEQRTEQRIIDENLRRLLRREGVRALPKAK